MASEEDPSGRAALRDIAYIRLEFIFTVLWDTALLLTAILARWLALFILRRTTPSDTQSWSIKALEWLCDVGIVLSVGIYTTFDLTKRVILGFKALRRTMRRDGER
jgi:hypothetical protein